MASSYIQLEQISGAHCMTLSLPDTMDNLDVDRLIQDVLETLTPHAAEKWVIDLSQVHYMGSSILGLMVNIREKIRQSKGTIALCGMSHPLLHIFKTCCLERLFKICKTRDEALGEMKKHQ